jgi:hypothetical protein
MVVLLGKPKGSDAGRRAAWFRVLSARPNPPARTNKHTVTAIQNHISAPCTTMPPLPMLLNNRLNVFEATRQARSYYITPREPCKACLGASTAICIGPYLSRDVIIQLMRDGNEHAATVQND